MVHGELAPLFSIDVIVEDRFWAGLTESYEGGKNRIYVTKGLVESLSKEELISVIAHEVAHVVRKSRKPNIFLKLAALSTSLAINIIILSIFLQSDFTSFVNIGSISAVLIVLSASFLVGEHWSYQNQELICDRFAASLVGPKTMVETLRLFDKEFSKPGAVRVKKPWYVRVWMWKASSHPGVDERVRNIWRNRHALRASSNALN